MIRQQIHSLCAAGLALFQGAASAITFDGATTYQSIDGIGANVNYRSWDHSNIPPVLQSFMDEAGASLFRLTFDLTNWETNNDDTSSTNYNWAYYNQIYSSPQFTKLWDMLEHLNRSGYSNRVILTFMGWGPSWMMDTDARSLKPGMEDEWAEMIASALIYARNTHGVQVSLVTPNNEPDIYDEGIRITNSTQYADTLHRLAAKLDAAGLTNLWFVGPCRSNGSTNFLNELTADETVMARLKHIGVHAYNNSQANAQAAVNWMAGSAYPDRTVWMTEYNTWCPTCDTTDTGFFDEWVNARATAEHLYYHLEGNASAALAWEGYDSIYAHHYNNWGYFGLVGVDDINAPVKTYTPRKSFYTVAQVSKWVRPGAQRIFVSQPDTWPLTYLTAFKHDALKQVVISGVNVSFSTHVLQGTLENLPAVTNLMLYYTSATADLVAGGNISVAGNGSFTATIPADCVFTLVGIRAEPLTQSSPTTVIGLSPNALAHYYFDVTNPVARVQFDVMNPTGDVSLFVDRDHPSDGKTLVPYASRQPGASAEQVVLREGTGVKALSAGRWYATVRNESVSPVAMSLRASQFPLSGLPLQLRAVTSPGLICLIWNAVPGASYVVEGTSNLASGPWQDLSGTLIAFGTNGTFCLPVGTAMQLFRVKEGVSNSSL
jgi:hypothetical protein